MKLLVLFLSVFLVARATAQDTFSIVAVDSITGEVGSAGASCVDLAFFPDLEDHFLGELFPGMGAINTQAWYIEANQINAHNRMLLGDSPQEIIDWLVANDVQNNPSLRQYGIVRLTEGSPLSAGHTGINTDDYKNHVLGPGYAIQGNILLGQEILDDMESNFLSAEGDLACKLMAALQGANVVGADTRCAANGTSSLFAFVKVAQQEDPAGEPSLVYSVSTSDGDGIEPVDALQAIFDAEVSCAASGLNEAIQNTLHVYPNPSQSEIRIEIPENIKEGRWELTDNLGREAASGNFQTGQDGILLIQHDLDSGNYHVRLFTEEGEFHSNILID